MGLVQSQWNLSAAFSEQMTAGLPDSSGKPQEGQSIESRVAPATPGSSKSEPPPTPGLSKLVQPSPINAASADSDSSLLTTDSLPVYCGFTKDMLRNKIRLSPDYKKASILLFRILYLEDEIRGRSLKGKKSKGGPSRPGLEDLSKLDLIYELVREKIPGTEPEAINVKIGHLLKPSGHSQLGRRQMPDGEKELTFWTDP